MRYFAVLSLAFGAALLAPIGAAAQSDDGYAQHDRFDRFDRDIRVVGWIADAHPGALVLANGRTVFLHDGTEIEPRGWRFRPGQRVDVFGSPAGNGSINARAIRVLHGRDRDRYDDEPRDR